jgi:hypothetical protein
MSKKSRRRRQVQAPPWGSPDVVRDEEGVREYDSGTPEEMLDPIKFKLDGYTYVCRELGALELSEIARMHGRPADSPESIAFMAETVRNTSRPGPVSGIPAALRAIPDQSQSDS